MFGIKRSTRFMTAALLLCGSLSAGAAGKTDVQWLVDPKAQDTNAQEMTC